MLLLSLFIGLVFAYGLISERIAQTPITGPMIFTVAGLAVAVLIPEQELVGGGLDTFLSIAELGLALLLFSDASRTDLRELGRDKVLALRLLTVGMLLTIALGASLAWLLFPALSLWQAGVVGAILAPTDAGLGQAIVQSEKVPLKLREVLGVEAGLNDGLCVPFLLFFLVMAEGTSGGSVVSLGSFIWQQLGLGCLIGAGIGLVGGYLLERAASRGWMAHSTRQLAVMALPVLCVLAAEALHASMFIAAFVAGLASQYRYRDSEHASFDFSSLSGELLNLFVFFLFGALALDALAGLQWLHLVYAFASLTVVRMLPVAIALIGSGLNQHSILFAGWFGPRGLASIVLGLVFLQQQGDTALTQMLQPLVIVTVLLSVLLHGASVPAGIRWLARRS
ncbi:MAG: cation:proton antiporter [Gammaproteobacteria bacterium]|jgi:NhaP-type Na+/H+ or K+/H+ antiporter|nr:cation:proton antiporter [Gammaproteobacteria bacterium]MBQ0773635.1 cation:proton antiporter [Gammaproteobacteria bacterium]|tara:strand:+ start:92973 stop:94157 length:1185 start_codon:yes stop_codon:yes gene_type:complete